jgi:hypothetical protein
MTIAKQIICPYCRASIVISADRVPETIKSSISCPYCKQRIDLVGLLVLSVRLAAPPAAVILAEKEAAKIVEQAKIAEAAGVTVTGIPTVTTAPTVATIPVGTTAAAKPSLAETARKYWWVLAIIGVILLAKKK